MTRRIGRATLIGCSAAAILSTMVASHASTPMNPGRPVILRKSGNGVFMTDLQVNGVMVRFIVDTGAARTVLTHDAAYRTGADLDQAESRSMSGLTGRVHLKDVRLHSMNFHGYPLGGVDATIGHSGLKHSLLGLPEIQRIGEVRVASGVMTIMTYGRT